MKMEYTAQVLRGWPYDGSLDRNESIATGQSLKNGDWVTKQTNNTVALSGTTATAAAGLVIVGNADNNSASVSGKAVVLWGGFIAQISNATTDTYVPGDAVTVISGKIAKAVSGTTTHPIVGYVLDVVAASATQTAHIVIKVA